MKNRFLLLGLLAAAAVVFAGSVVYNSRVVPEFEGTLSAPVRIVAADNGWDSQKFHNAVAKFIVENGFDGYVITNATGSTPLNWQAIIAGDVDLDIETWPDNVLSFEDDVKNGDIIPLSVIVEDTAQGFYVPRYVVHGDPERGIAPVAPELKTVEDLKKYPGVFKDPEDPRKNRIYGAIPGWMIDNVMYNKFLYYGLDEMYNYFRSGSEAVLFTSLSSAYNLGEPWAGYCWEPAWISGKLDLILLEDAPFDPELYEKGGCEIPKQALRIVSSNKFASRAPDLVDFFSRYKTGSQKVSEVLAYLDDTNASHEAVAVWFLKNNDSLLDEWLEPGPAARVREALSRM